MVAAHISMAAMTELIPRGSLIVSCQARADNPLHGPTFMGAMALAARDGGASAIRANGAEDVAAVKAAGLPVIGINKVFDPAQFQIVLQLIFMSRRADCNFFSIIF